MTAATFPELGYFTGSENMYTDKMFPGYKYSDGVKYVRDNGGNWLVVDSLLECMHHHKIVGLEFVVIKARPNDKGGATVEFLDDDNLIMTREYAISDLATKIKFYLIDKTLILAGEY